MIEIEDAIGQVENLYRALTGMTAPTTEVAYAPIPAEKDPVLYVQDQMDRLLGALAVPVPAAAVARATRAWTPLVSVTEKNGDGGSEIVVSFDVPGVTRERIEVAVQGGALVVTGQRTAVDGEQTLVLNERPMGPFRRVLPLPPGLKTAEMAAQLREGVLEVRIPREAGQGAVARNVPVA